MKSKRINALDPPPISEHKEAREIMRIWTGPGLPQQVRLNTTWKDPGAWGIMLVDIAKHVAKAYASNGVSEKEALQKIKQLFDMEWNSATDQPHEIE